MREERRHGHCPGDRSPFIGRSPHLHPQASRAKSPPTCSRVPAPRRGAGSHTSLELTRDAKEAKRRTQGIKLPCGYKRSLILVGTSGRKGEPPRWEHTTAPRLCTLSASSLSVDLHEGPVPPTMQSARWSLRSKELHHHLRQYHAFSTAEPVPRLKTAPRVTQQCQLGAAVTSQSAAGLGTTVDMAKSGPAITAATGGRKQRSDHPQAHVFS
jgi:hypothetical protein